MRTDTPEEMTTHTLRTAIEHRDTLADVLADVWWFVENVSDDTPDRTDRFFALRERVRDALALAGR